MSGVIFLQRVDDLQPVAAAVQDQCRQQSRRAPIAILVRVNRGELVVRQRGDDRHGQVARLDLVIDPCDWLSHQPRDLLRLRWQVGDGTAGTVADHVLTVAIRCGRLFAVEGESMNRLEVLLGELALQRRPRSPPPPAAASDDSPRSASSRASSSASPTPVATRSSVASPAADPPLPAKPQSPSTPSPWQQKCKNEAQ